MPKRRMIAGRFAIRPTCDRSCCEHECFIVLRKSVATKACIGRYAVVGHGSQKVICRVFKENLADNLVHMDMKLRYALGIFEDCSVPKQWIEKRITIIPCKRPIRYAPKCWLASLFGVRVLYLVVDYAHQADMELRLCRIQEPELQATGIQEWGSVIIETPLRKRRRRAYMTNYVSLQALAAQSSGDVTDSAWFTSILETQEAWERRLQRRKLEKRRLQKRRLSCIRLDKAIRDQLKVKPGDVVRVRRNVLVTFLHELVRHASPTILGCIAILGFYLRLRKDEHALAVLLSIDCLLFLTAYLILAFVILLFNVRSTVR